MILEVRKLVIIQQCLMCIVIFHINDLTKRSEVLDQLDY